MKEDKIKSELYDTMSKEIKWLRSKGNAELKLNYVTMMYDHIQIKLKEKGVKD